MVYTVSVKNLSFKQDLSNINLMLLDQQATYAILKYAYDVPKELYDWVLDELVDYKDAIIHRKLAALISTFKNPYDISLIDSEDNTTCYIELDFNKMER